jgi:dihydropteroate synthase
MGILNVTPDSFSDGGRYADTGAALRRGMEMAEEGADLIDVGGESTRPGSVPVPVEEELARVVPVIEGLGREFRTGGGPLISVDTRKAEVAERALAAGAHVVNDVTALAGDAGMPGVVRRYGAGVVLMHMRGEPATMQDDPQYADVVKEVGSWLESRIGALVEQGLEERTLAVDPGIGFGKTAEHNLRILARLEGVAVRGRPLVVGLSRKRFLGKVTGQSVEQRLAGSVAGLVYAAMRGAQVVRVHDVRASVDAVRFLEAVRREETVAWSG